MVMTASTETAPEPKLLQGRQDISYRAATETAPESFTLQLEATLDLQATYEAMSEGLPPHWHPAGLPQALAKWKKESPQLFAEAEAKLKDAYRELARLHAEQLVWASLDTDSPPTKV